MSDALLFDPIDGPYLAGTVDAYGALLQMEFLQYQLENPDCFNADDQTRKKEDWATHCQLRIMDILQKIILTHRLPFVLQDVELDLPSAVICQVKLTQQVPAVIRITLPILSKERKRNVRKDRSSGSVSTTDESRTDQQESPSTPR